MPTLNDAPLLRDYARTGSERAFGELVLRHTNLVYSAALRQTGCPELAREITQDVFTDLARKAAALAEKMHEDAALGGWLYKSTRYLALNALRDERRRVAREQKSMHDVDTAPDADAWAAVAPVLDEAMAELNDTEREAVLLRYFQNLDFHAVGRAQGVSDDTAQKRVTRAVEHLRELLEKRGVTVGGSGLVILISTNAVGMAPAGLAVAVAAVAIGNFVTTTAAATTVIMSTNQKLLLTATLLAFLGLTVHQFFKANPSQESVAPVALAHGTGGGNQSRSTAGRSRAESFAPTTRRAGKVTPDFVALADALRAALHAAPRSRLGTRSYPPDEVAQAILNYGSYRKEAFSILVEAARSADLETRKRAISAMGFVGMPSTPQRAQQGLIGEPAPDAKAFLWAVVREPNQELAHFALSGLRSIGFDATEIPSLVALMMKGSDDQLRRYLPEVIAETLAADPVSAAPYLAELEELLNHADPRLRFQAACALAKQRAATQPEILPHLTTGLQSREHLEQLMALETLQKIGKDAEPVLPALMTYANTVQDDVLRRVAFTTIGAIKQELRSVLTGVDQALQEQERTAKWQQKFTSGDYSHEDLMAALKEPLFTVRAAQKLAESGVAAKDAVPAMLESLAGKDQASRDQIMEAIGKIDPSVTVSKINSRIVAQAGVYARLKLEEQEPTKERAFMVRLLQKQLMGNSEWVTQEELRLLAQQIAEVDAQAHEIFVTELLKRDSTLTNVSTVSPRK